MAKIVVRGVPPYDGEYEVDTDRSWNTREWSWIKKISGYLPLTVQDGFAGNDPELFLAVAVICMARAGKIDREDALRVAEIMSEAPYEPGTFTLIGDVVEADEVPLDLTSPPADPSRNDSPSNEESKTANGLSSGPSSPPPSAPLDATPVPTTLLRLGTSSV
jgi:hypothetical protein